ncbi:MAG: helix-turn-helix transcriptional regulator [Clostridia bacterium]|jgi:plasmid maintenance system antidote protein VapI|nr:helix-turn-helix transcriptional regulator [Clostridia bacterium]MCI8944256.1 helix-turn-helix transcriptional regulator [Clostridia bacterium]MCI9291660.1 helix-turn-helix transcriptional regulator [Clostridia bacterium]MDE6885202.1 helix-turn-helix domain-containing protein [Clostridia bacterium]
MNKQYMSNFANNLKELIGDMSVNEFSKKVGIPQQTLSRYINMQREITLDNLCKIADYFDEDIDVLLGRKNY